MTVQAEPSVRAPSENSRDGAPKGADGYGQGHDRPLAGYVKLMTVYGAVVGTAALVARRRHLPLPTRIGPYDLGVMALATHRLSVLVAKDSVTSPIRAPFTRYEGVEGPSKLKESVRGEGVRHSIGELLTCPFCLSQWTATGFAIGTVFAPRATRLVATTFAAVGLADLLQFARAKAQQATSG